MYNAYIRKGGKCTYNDISPNNSDKSGSVTSTMLRNSPGGISGGAVGTLSPDRSGHLLDYITLDVTIMNQYKALISDTVKINRSTITYESYIVECTLVGYGAHSVEKIASVIKYYLKWYATSSMRPPFAWVPISIYMYKISSDKVVDTSKFIRGSNIVLGPNNVNTGFTVIHDGSTGAPQRNNIFIYRTEEAIKVLFHELVHATFMEYAFMAPTEYDTVNDMVRRIWLIKSPLVMESVTDALAIKLYTYYTCCRGSKYGERSKPLEDARKAMLAHVWKQAAIVYLLAGYTSWPGLSIHDETTRPKAFMQETHVFEYYIIKAFILTMWPADNGDKLTAKSLVRYCDSQEMINQFNDSISKITNGDLVSAKLSMKMTDDNVFGAKRESVRISGGARESSYMYMMPQCTVCGRR